MFFITGNQYKFREAQRAVPGVTQKDLDLTEIQETDTRSIIAHKLDEAARIVEPPFFVEDVSMAIDHLGGFPGPLIKWMLKHMGADGIHECVGDSPATVKCSIGLYQGGEKHFFEGEVRGHVCEPRGKRGFGFDPIFIPEGAQKSFGEMTLTEKRQFSHREKALCKLAQFVRRQAPLVMVFGTFDVLHPGHLHFFAQARRYGERLLVVLARDSTIERVKGEAPRHTEKERLLQVSRVPAVDTAVLGSKRDQYALIRKYKPSVIALGHDQESFVEGLDEFLKRNGLDSRIVRLSPYRRDMYSSSKLKALKEHKRD